MAKYRFTRNHHEFKRGQIVEGMQFDEGRVMIQNRYSTGYVSTIEPVMLGSQRLLVKLK